MQENRSFDHYFGTMRGVRGFGDRHPIPLASGKPVWHQSDGTREIPPFHLDSEVMNAALINSTPHSVADSQAAWNQGKFGQWARFKTPLSMGYYTREEMPFQFALAEAFTICDGYHCSITTGTDPNRIVFWSGSNFNPELRAAGINCTDADAESWNLRCWIKGPARRPAIPIGRMRSMADDSRCPRAGRHRLAHLSGPEQQLDRRHARVPGVRELPERAARLVDLPERACRTGRSMNSTEGRAEWHAAAGLLGAAVADRIRASGRPVQPEPRRRIHPAGARSAYRESRRLGKTVFFLTFDENDGLFDHLPPPAVPSYNADGTLAGKSTIELAGMYRAQRSSPRSGLQRAERHASATTPIRRTRSAARSARGAWGHACRCTSCRRGAGADG